MVAEYFRSRDLKDAAVSAVFLSGRAFPRSTNARLQIGGARCGSWSRAYRRSRWPSITAAYRKRGDLGAAAFDVLLATAPTHVNVTLQDVRSAFDQIAETRTAAAKAAILKSLLRARHCARSQVHPEDHYRRPAYRAERKSGRRGDRQSLRRTAGAACSAPTCCWAISATRCNWRPRIRSGRSAHADVSSHWLHAGQPGSRCRRGVPLLRARPGRGQVRRHPRPGALRRRPGSAVLAHARRSDAIVSRTGRAARRVRGRRDPRRRDRRLAAQRRTAATLCRSAKSRSGWDASRSAAS